MKHIILSVCIICSIGLHAMTREPPKRYSDRVNVVEDGSELVIVIETEFEPKSYGIYEIYIFGPRDEDVIVLNSRDSSMKTKGDNLILVISGFTKKFEIIGIGVMLMRRGKMEYYSMSKDLFCP